MTHSHMAWRDLLDEAVAGILARPARLVLTTLGTVLGVAALVATVGIAQTAGGQIAEQFDVLTATEVVVEPRTAPGSGQDGGDRALATLPWDAAARAAALSGVEAAGTLSEVDLDAVRTRTVPVVDPQGSVEHALPVVATSPGLLEAVRGELATGRYFDAGHDARADRVVVLGARAAERLHVTWVGSVPALFLGDEVFTIIGVAAPVPRRVQLDDAVILPQATAREVFELAAPDQLYVRTALGAAQQVGEQLPIALAPNDPDGFDARVPPSPDALQGRVQADVNALFLALGAVALVVGALGIANVTLLSVLERIGEIGLRGALGATRAQIARQFLAESVAIGLLGGLVGTSVGVLATVGVSLSRSWTPLLDGRLVVAAPVLGAVIGLVAGTYPAWKAATIEPITALRASD